MRIDIDAAVRIGKIKSDLNRRAGRHHTKWLPPREIQIEVQIM